jgi:hypothetical protein
LRLRSAGAQHLLLNPMLDDAEQLEQLSEAVIPLVEIA